MASKLDYTLEVSPDTDVTYRFDFSAWSVIVDGDTIASAVITWEPPSTAPGTVGTPTPSSPADEFMTLHLAGFADGLDYRMRMKVTTTNGEVEDYYFRFNCGEPRGY